MEVYSLHLLDTYNSKHRQRLGSSRTRKFSKKERNLEKNSSFFSRTPRLALMVRQYLVVPATAASPERLFSGVGIVKSDLRGMLLDSILIDVMWSKQAP